MNPLAERYARALFLITRGEEDLREICALFTGTPALWEALTSPAISVQEKHAVLDRLPQLADRPVLLHFTKLLADKGRMSLLPEIVTAFSALILELRNAATCVMTCVRPPKAEQQARIKEMLCKLHGKSEVLLDIRIDPALLGGFLLEIEGVTYDKSVRGQLRRLSRHLQERRMV